eukprot:TRINITY_DN4209_c0_g1_i2.p1 TRINITY_DN4209_c0_g1~~TRINITY_DN4209_c0_g1_i2.p1  ORF type:complete len:252 (-),score=23.51 TRINITY_DN4209_c0_g1_i2:14-769(-)
MNRAKFSVPPKNVTFRPHQNSPSRTVGNENISNQRSPARPSSMNSNGTGVSERISPVKNSPFHRAAAPTTPLTPKSNTSVTTPPRTPINTVTKPNTITTRSPTTKTSPVRPAPTVTASPSRPAASPSNGIQYQQCHACRTAITSGRLIQAAGMKFHGECFNCAKCHSNMSVSTRYIQLNGQLLCSACGTEAQVKSKPVCYACHDHLVGDCMEANGHHYHAKCFACYKCRTSLVHGDVYLAGTQLSCQRCKK